MQRTTVMLPADLHQRALRHARAKGVSLACLVRDALTRELARSKGDECFLLRDVVWEGPVAHDASARHDDIYDEDAS